ncbi:MAG: hypothetical protein COA58_04200 [Bacteroidetes bacterium]|nr:MAG: hypothetical protein COA58_04200 [Bacteroidota bacterium]
MRSLSFVLSFFLITFFCDAQNGLHFDGTDDGVNCGVAPALNVGGTAFSIESWIYADSWKTNAYQGTIVLKENNSNNGGFMFRAGDGGKVNFGIGAGVNGAWTELTTSAILNTGTWYHLAGTYDGSYLRIYIDGVIEDSVSSSISSSGAASTSFTIGYHPAYTGRNWSGIIDEVRIWDTTLSSSQIANNRNSEFCDLNVSHLAGYYKLDEGIAQGNNTGVTVTNDYSGNSNNGTLNNFALSGSNSNWDNGVALIQDTVETLDSSTHCAAYYDSQLGMMITTTGSFFKHYISYTGCDSLHKRYIEILSNSRDTIIESVCDSFISPTGKVIRSTGIYYDFLPNAIGCDSIILMDITVVNDSSFIDTATCDSYVSNWGLTYSQSGTYFKSFTSSLGCDSIVQLNLDILPESYSSLNLLTCDSVQNVSMTKWLKPGDNIFDTISNVAGCDSIITVGVTSSASTSVITAAECLSFVSPSGKEITSSGTFLDTVVNYALCDSIITIHLTIHNPSSSSFDLVGCDSIILPTSGNLVKSSGTYYDTLVNSQSCDSFITMNVTINVVNSTVEVADYWLKAESPTGTYQWLYCDKAFRPVQGETSAKFDYDSSGSYSVEVSDNGCVDTSNCYNLTGLGVNNAFFSRQLILMPNPSKGHLTIKTESQLMNGPITIYDAKGQKVFEDMIQNRASYTLKENWNPGIYLIDLRSDDNRYIGRMIINKN